MRSQGDHGVANLALDNTVVKLHLGSGCSASPCDSRCYPAGARQVVYGQDLYRRRALRQAFAEEYHARNGSSFLALSCLVGTAKTWTVSRLEFITVVVKTGEVEPSNYESQSGTLPEITQSSSNLACWWLLQKGRRCYHWLILVDIGIAEP